jgi:hypothetical protein
MRKINKSKRNERMKMLSLSNDIIAYESGELNYDETLALFQNLVNTELAWSLQGSYGRMAKRLIDDGLITT